MFRNYSKNFISRTLFAIVCFNVAFMTLLSATQIENVKQFLGRDRNNQTVIGENNKVNGLTVNFECTSEQVNFIISNPTRLSIGEFELSIIEDDVILFIKKYTLNPRDSINLSFPDNGMVYKVKIELLEGSPHPAPLVKTFNSCNSDNLNFFKKSVTNTVEEHFNEIEQNQVTSLKAKIFNIESVNVVGNELEVQTSSIEDNVKLIWTVIDLNGKILAQGKTGLNSGDNILNMNLQEIKIGFYILLIQSNIESYKKNFKIIN
ncbi:MAG: hypothetical protein ABI851_10970 [Saprospiraceae bacterium]